jgi:hypothetical protein
MRNQLKHILLFLIMVAATNVCSVCANEKKRDLHISYPGIRINAERDFAYSPLMYTGVQGSLAIAYSVIKSNSTDLVFLNYSSGNNTNRFGSSMKVQTAGIQAYKFFHLKKNTDHGFCLGWSNNNEFNTREVEEVRNFNNRNEYFTTFGPAIRYRYPFSLFNRQFHIQTLAHIQLLGFKLQSSYVTSLPSGFQESSSDGLQAVLKSVELFYPGNGINVGIQPTMMYELKSGNALSISYRYDYLKIKGPHDVEKSRGTWYVGIITGL